MVKTLNIHAVNPQARYVNEVVSSLKNKELIACPTDASYVFICTLNNKDKLEQIIKLRSLSSKHPFTLMCKDIAMAARYAYIGNNAFAIMKNHTPAPVTYILAATKLVPKTVANSKRKNVGIRVPDNKVCQAIIEALDEPIVCSTLSIDGEVLSDPYDIASDLKGKLDLVIDTEVTSKDVTTVADLSTETLVLERQGIYDFYA